MNISELKAASNSLTRLQRAENDLDAIKDYEVVGVRITRSGSTLADGIRLERGGCSGSGAITSICYDEEMQAALTAALLLVFSNRAAAAKTELESLGVRVEDQ